MATTNRASLVDIGRRVLQMEADALGEVAARLDEAFTRAVDICARARGRIIVSGVGKSGLIARKIAATLTSTGTPATYLHPVDSQHGDLGIVGQEDVAILVSKSGETQELFGLVNSLQRMRVPIISITGQPQSTLAKLADEVLDAGVPEEACPLDLAPTTSTTVALAIGDALAVALLEVKGFRHEDFAALHPGGALGRRLLLRVRELMQPPDGVVSPDGTMRQAVIALAQYRGLAMVVTNGTLLGVITTGDLARLAEREPDFLDVAIDRVMTKTPKVAHPEDLAAAAVGTMERNGVIALPVLDDHERVVGVVHLHDLMRAGAV
ncbi:MAG: KpsF/GutQ family sugar-phosphate isomerase [Gemmatimonadales bacterium]|nr:MAG: KpsF/GutQ family sugar-phosphate isomerase [Gemmatimonadales bacterium]